MPEFDDLKPWPDDEQIAGRHHNQPPLEERILQEFDELLAIAGVRHRIREISEAAERAPMISSSEDCGAAGDLIKMAKAATEQVDEAREKLNRPLLNAQRALKGKADELVAPMQVRIAGVKASLDDYMASHPDAVRGDYGAKVSRATKWNFEIESLAKVPKDIREAEPVVEAIRKVIAGRIRAGERTIAGVRIWSDQAAAVRRWATSQKPCSTGRCAAAAAAT